MLPGPQLPNGRRGPSNPCASSYGLVLALSRRFTFTARLFRYERHRLMWEAQVKARGGKASGYPGPSFRMGAGARVHPNWEVRIWSEGGGESVTRASTSEKKLRVGSTSEKKLRDRSTSEKKLMAVSTSEKELRVGQRTHPSLAALAHTHTHSLRSHTHHIPLAALAPGARTREGDLAVPHNSRAGVRIPLSSLTFASGGSL
jgi:hypothetical protein